jgi:CRP/FNR family cyclic AMP-dependent transcriptional regulator
MRTTIALSEGLRDEDMLWLFQVGEKKIVNPGTALVHEGVRPNAIFIVIRGGFSVGVETLANEPLAKLGAGELIGEISFLEGSPASATIVADEESAVLVVDSQVLNERVREDTAFAARVYRAFALVAERRLRNRVDHLACLFELGRGLGSQRDACACALD